MYLRFPPPLPRERFRIVPGRHGQDFRILFNSAETPEDDS